MEIKLVIEKHSDGYLAYPLGIQGIVIGEGNSFEEAVDELKSAIRFHIESFGSEVVEMDSPVLEAFIAEVQVAV